MPDESGVSHPAGNSEPAAGGVGVRLELTTRLAHALSQPPDARALAAAAREMAVLADEVGDRSAKADALHLQGHAMSELGLLDEAKAAFTGAVELWEAEGLREEELRSRQGLVNVLQLLGEPEAALSQAALAAQAESWFRHCTGLLSIGGILEQLGRYDEALAKLDEAAQVLADSGAKPQHIAHLKSYLCGNRANVHLAMGNARAALDASHEMSAAAERGEVRRQRLEALINEGVCRTRLGDLAEGWRRLEQARHAAGLADDRVRVATANAALAEWYVAAGLCEQAMGCAQDALTAAQDAKARFAELYARMQLAEAQLEAGQLEPCAESIARAREVGQSLNAPNYLIIIAILQARLDAASGRVDGASPDVERAVRDAARLQAMSTWSEANVVLADLLLRAGETDAARDAAEKGVAQALRLEAKRLVWRCRHVQGVCDMRAGRLEHAIEKLTEATKVIERMWWPLWTEGFARVEAIAGSMVDVYLDLLRAASLAGRTETVERVLALSPWPFIRGLWERAEADPRQDSRSPSGNGKE